MFFNYKSVAILALVISTTGCASLGVGEPDFACKGRPDGVRCISSAEAYKGSNHTDRLRAVNPETGEVIPGGMDEEIESIAEPMSSSRRALEVVPLPAKPYPVRTPSKVIRVWVAPWVDKSDNLHAGGYLFAEIEKRTWTLGEINMNNRIRLRPLESLSIGGKKSLVDSTK